MDPTPLDAATPDIPAPGFRCNHRRNLPCNHRKQFTVTERLAIAQRIVERMSGRNGVRHDTAAAKEKFPEVTGQTRDIAAAKAGLGSGKTLEAAQKVVEHGTPELVEAMDSGKVGIHAAATDCRSAWKYP
ncbi:hypothetical protein [Zoogloea sp. LCSB751]|uniref:hypothetical protein n=1 Tax=Zoogloea sp. LCSB751 TaxID=1965277 RepID=UPI0011163908|nr:hypothetical protein [Zoogloea sp. LCSB751]